jgi:hypothetical protein
MSFVVSLRFDSSDYSFSISVLEGDDVIILVNCVYLTWDV